MRRLTAKQHAFLFWRKVRKNEAGCWIWVGDHDAYGYGRLMRAKRWLKAHRVAWELVFGGIPAAMSVCHHCDVRDCVRPDHLFLGTNADNLADMRAKGRERTNPLRGESCHQSKLSEDDVREIRISYLRGKTQVALARRYKVEQGTISKVIRRASWKHVT